MANNNENRNNPIENAGKAANTANNFRRAFNTASSKTAGSSAASGAAAGATSSAGGTAGTAATGATAATGVVAGGSVGIIILIVLFIVIFVIGFISLILVAVNASTLFNTEPTKIEYVVEALEEGFVQTKVDSRDYIADYVNSTYKCGGGGMSSLKNKNTFTYSTDACEITIEFEPDLIEFAQHIDSHANAVNSTLQFFEEGGSKNITENEFKDFESLLLRPDSEGNFFLSHYGLEIYNSYNSEYVNNQSSAYFDTLRRYSYDIFDFEKNTGAWIFSNFYIGKKPKEVTVCYKRVRDVGMTYDYEPVACSLPHDVEKTEIEYVDAQFGHISVPMTYDVEKYKRAVLDKCIDNLINKEMFLPVHHSRLEYEKQKITTREKAEEVVNNILSDYEMSYLVMYIGGSYGYGYDGIITSKGFNYTVTTDDPVTTALFWAYSATLDAILHNLPYRTTGPGSGPDMTHQCTQFAATFFYDVYGFAALRGNGNMQADNLIKDCGPSSACPVKFERSTSAAPGAIVSLYPNHVVVIDQVDSDGSVYISEGNYNGKGAVRTHQKYSSLNDYISSTGYTIKTIAIAIR